MKILQLVTKRQYRGAEVFAANLSSELIKLGHSIFFVGLYQNNENVLTVKNAENVDLRQSKDGMLSLGLIKDLASYVTKVKPDVIQCNGSDTLKYMVLASFTLSFKPPIIYRNISMISEWLSNDIKRTIYKGLFKKVSHVTSVGEEAIADFVTTFNYPKDQTSVIRRGIPLTEFDHKKSERLLRKELDLSEEDQIVMHIGNFSHEKNHQFLVEIFNSIKTKHSNIKLVCVGDGALFNEIQTSIIQNNLSQTIFLLGFRKNISELLAGADFFVLSSKVEGVPGVILEAATQKKPAIATNVGGVSEVLLDDKTGFIINNFNKIEFENKIIQLATNNELRREMGANAYKQVIENFNPIKNAKKFEDLYLRLIPMQ